MTGRIVLRLLQVIDMVFQLDLPFALDAERKCLTVLLDEDPIQVRTTDGTLWDVTELVAHLDARYQAQEAA